VRAVIYPLKDAEGRISEVVLIHEDITDQVRADEQRREATELLTLVVQQSGEAIIVTDASGVLRVFNPAAEQLHGVRADATPSREWTERYGLLRTDGTELPYTETALYRALLGESVDEAQWLVKRSDGSIRRLVGSAAPLRRSDGTSAGAVLIARDETARFAYEEQRERLLLEAQRAHRELEAASRMKDEFLATLSHELRTPLNAILGWTRILSRSTLDPSTTHALEVIHRNAVAQARLVDDLLDVSSIMSGKIRLNLESVDLGVVAAAAVETVRPAAEAKGLQIVFELDPELPPIAGDMERLQQVFWNLLSNAVKFTERGGRILLRLSRDGATADIVLRDTGVGIGPDMLPHVFDRFTQADSSTTRAHAGLGLGLAIVRHLVESHGGSVSAESDGLGKGSLFRVRLPLPSAS
jgi:PAS domain S-box-containing protein